MVNEPPQNLPVSPNGSDPLKEFLKREEIKTMEKDVDKLRENEARQEREKIIKIRVEAPPLSPPPLTKTPGPIPQPSTPATTTEEPTEEKNNLFRKILVRGGLIVFGLLILISVFWFLGARNWFKSEPAPIDNQPETSQSGAEQLPAVILSKPLIAVSRTEILKIASNEQIPAAINQLLDQGLPEEEFIRLAIENSKENRLASLSEIAGAFQIEAPLEILQKLDQNYTLVIIKQKEGVRFSLVAKTTDKNGLIKSLKEWETKTAKTGANIGEKKFPPLSSSFKTAAWQKTSFRYLTLGKNDSGICYLVIDDYFVLTSSFGSMKKIIEELNVSKNLGQMLITGFEGTVVTPQLEEFFKKYKPGGVLLLGKNIENAEQLKNLTGQLQALSQKETGQPLLIMADQESGNINRINFLDEKTAAKDIADVGQSYQVGKARAQELKQLGINVNLAPVLDWAAAGDFIFERSFQKPAEEVGELAKAMIFGQNSERVLTAIKHFPGYAGIAFNPEEQLAETEKTPEISQFQKAMEVNPQFVMTANVIYKEIDSILPFSFSPQGVQLLKDKLGQNILIMSDDLDQNSLINKFSLKEIVANPIEAGIDLLMFSGYRLPAEQGLDEFFRAYLAGEITREKAEKAVDRIIQLKNKLLK